MILVSLFVSLTIVFALGTMVVSEVLLSGTPKRTPAIRTLPLPRTMLIKQEIELTADSGVFIVS